MHRTRKRLITLVAIVTLALTTTTVSALSSHIVIPERVVADPTETVPTPAPRSVMEIKPYLPQSLRKAAETYPAQYDLRELGLVTSVKDQGDWGTCWAFGALSSAESNLIKNGYEPSSINLSEAHLVYYYYNRQNDPLGNTAGDKVIVPKTDEDGNPTDIRKLGGDDKMTLLALSGWTGPVSESLLPYASLSNLPSLRPDASYDNRAILKSAYILSDDPSELKAALMKYGAVNGAYHQDERYSSQDTNAYYCGRSLPANHEISVVGWDDDYSRDHFDGADKPSRDGAWIIKNSWGTGIHENGYFYLSYEDDSFCDLVAYDYLPAGTYDHNYHYDGTPGDIYFDKISPGIKASNIYEVKGNPGGKEALNAVSFVCYTPGTQYSIQVYKDLEKKTNPESGTALLTTPITRTVAGAGVTTAQLPEGPVLTQGTTYSMVITITATPSTQSTLGIEHSIPAQSGMGFQAAVAPNQSFLYEDGTWIDLARETEACLRIKGFTSDIGNSGDDTPPTAPGAVSVSASSNNYNSVTLSWNDIQASGYDIYRSSTEDGIYKKCGESTDSTAHVDTRLVTGTVYYYKVKAYIEAEGQKTYGPFSAIVSASPKLTKPTITLKSGKGKVTVVWTKTAGATGYQVYRSTSKSKPFSRVKSTAARSFTNTGLSNKKAYYYKVRAYKKSNGRSVFGGYSSIKGTKTK